MKIFQKPAVLNSSSILKINNDTFAEIVDKNDKFFNFRFYFKISLTNSRKNPREYEKVVITVKRKESELDSSSSIFSNIATDVTGKSPNANLRDDVIMSSRLNSSLSSAVLPDKVSKKLYSGLKLVKDLQKKEQFISQASVSITALVSEALDEKYSFVELYANEYKRNLLGARIKDSNIRNELIVEENASTVFDKDTSRINPSSLIGRINSELCDITQPLSEDSIKNLTSESLLDNPKMRISEISKGRSPLFFDIAKHYLNDIPGLSEENIVWYDKRVSIKKSEDLEASQIIPVSIGNRNLNLTVRFDLYKIGSNVVEETYTADLFMPSHVEAFECISTPPEIKICYKKDNNHVITIFDRESPGKIQGYNIYQKTISEQGSVSDYKKLGEIKNKKIDEYTIFATSNLSVVRVIPVDSQNKETNIFTNIVVGPGHKTICNLAILPSHFGKSQIKIDVVNVPTDCISLTLYRRDCTDNNDGNFYAVETLKITNSILSAVIIDQSAEIGKTYEYYVISISLSEILKEEISNFSNFAIFRNSLTSISEGSINVKLSNPSMKIGQTCEFSFELSTSVLKSENEKITQSLKEQLGELYDQYLNPSTNSSSPLGEDYKGIPQYSSLFFHEIVRTNLNTAERETFELASDGIFKDNQESQILSNVKAINPQHVYNYQVFTYRKNPVEIFKKFVASGIDTKGREWFYLPYKWKQPIVKVGKLYADDLQGLPVVDAYDNFTSEPFGITAQCQTDSLTTYFSISQVNCDRVDVNTVKVTWYSENNLQDLVDSFVVMKVVNGVRSFVGRTCKDYIYHQLSEDDVGSLYYIVVPIMSEFDVYSPSYSDVIYISPEGIAPKIKSRIDSLSNDVSSKIKENLFNSEKNKSLISSVMQNKLIKKF